MHLRRNTPTHIIIKLPKVKDKEKTLKAARESSGQDGGIGRNPSLPRTTKKRITTNLKSINNQKCQKIKLHGNLATKELKSQPDQPDWCTKTKKYGPKGIREPQRSQTQRGTHQGTSSLSYPRVKVRRDSQKQQEENRVTYKGVPIRLSDDFLKEILPARRGSKEAFKS